MEKEGVDLRYTRTLPRNLAVSHQPGGGMLVYMGCRGVFGTRKVVLGLESGSWPWYGMERCRIETGSVVALYPSNSQAGRARQEREARGC